MCVGPRGKLLFVAVALRAVRPYTEELRRIKERRIKERPANVTARRLCRRYRFPFREPSR
mgnify:CR=1 FL=1|jgi:hypothetical protein